MQEEAKWLRSDPLSADTSQSWSTHRSAVTHSEMPRALWNMNRSCSYRPIVCLNPLIQRNIKTSKDKTSENKQNWEGGRRSESGFFVSVCERDLREFLCLFLITNAVSPLRKVESHKWILFLRPSVDQRKDRACCFLRIWKFLHTPVCVNLSGAYLVPLNLRCKPVWRLGCILVILI